MEKIYIKYKPYDGKQLKEACKIMEEMGYKKRNNINIFNKPKEGILKGCKTGIYMTDDLYVGHKLIKDLTKESFKLDWKTLKLGDIIQKQNRKKNEYYFWKVVRINYGGLKLESTGSIINYGIGYSDINSLGDIVKITDKTIMTNEERKSYNKLTKEEFKIGDTIEVINKNLKSNYGYVYNIKKIEGDYIVTDENLDFKKSSIKKVYLDGMGNTDEHEEDYQFKIGDRVQLENKGTWYHYRYGNILAVIGDDYLIGVDNNGNALVNKNQMILQEEQTGYGMLRKTHNHCIPNKLNLINNNNNTMENLNIEQEALELEANKYFEFPKTQKEIIKVKNYLQDKRNIVYNAIEQLRGKERLLDRAKNSLIDSANRKDIAVVKEILKNFKADKEFLNNFMETKVNEFKIEELEEVEYNPEYKWN